MKQEDKELLLKDLCGRLPYGVIVQSRIIDFYAEESAHDHFPNHVKHPSYVGNGILFSIDTLSNSVCIRPILKNLTYREQVFFEDICKNGYIPIDECKPYLFPLWRMTKKQKEEFDALYWEAREKTCNDFEFKCVYSGIKTDWFNKNHFDYRGLIKRGFAIDATNLGIY